MKHLCIGIAVTALFALPLLAQGQATSAQAPTSTPGASAPSDTGRLEGVLPTLAGQVNYTAVVEIAGAGKGDLKSRFRSWFASVNREAKDAVQLDDKETGEMVVRTSVLAQWQIIITETQTLKTLFAIKMAFKDGRYRYQLTDFQVQNVYEGKTFLTKIEAWNASRSKNRRKFFVNLDARLAPIIASMKEAMQKPSVSKDW